MNNLLGEIELHILTSSYTIEERKFRVFCIDSEIKIIGLKGHDPITAKQFYDIIRRAEKDKNVIKLNMDPDVFKRIEMEAIADEL